MSGVTSEPKLALAVNLLINRKLSLAAAAKLSGLSESEFIDYLKQFKIDIVSVDAQTVKEMDILNSWMF